MSWILWVIGLLAAFLLGGTAAAAAANQSAKRAEKVKTVADRFGTRWIVLPNAVYGQAVDNGIKFGPKALFRSFSGWAKDIFLRR